MTLPILSLLPTQMDFSYRAQASQKASFLEGVNPNVISDKIKGHHFIIQAQWILKDSAYSDFASFYNTDIAGGVLPFSLNLSTDSPFLQPHLCVFMAISATHIKGVFRIEATLAAQPIPHEADCDRSIIALYECYGQQSDDILLCLADLVNTTFPETLRKH